MKVHAPTPELDDDCQQINLHPVIFKQLPWALCTDFADLAQSPSLSVWSVCRSSNSPCQAVSCGTLELTSTMIVSDLDPGAIFLPNNMTWPEPHSSYYAPRFEHPPPHFPNTVSDLEYFAPHLEYPALDSPVSY